MQEMRDSSSIPIWDIPLEEEMATHSRILAWRIPWTEGPGGLQSMGSQRVGHGRVTEHTSSALRKGRCYAMLFDTILFIVKETNLADLHNFSQDYTHATQYENQN